MTTSELVDLALDKVREDYPCKTDEQLLVHAGLLFRRAVEEIRDRLGGTE